jgi:hypothetical protein
MEPELDNLLAAVEARAKESGVTFTGAKRATQGTTDSVHNGALIKSVFPQG